MAKQMGQAGVIEQLGQAAMGALAQEITRALREPMNILGVDNQT